MNFELNDVERAAFDEAIAALENFSLPKPAQKRKRRGPKPRMAERARQMEQLYRGGMTLQDIGTRFGVTRERTRQILKKQGLTYRDGGQCKRAEEKRAARKLRIAAATASRKDPKCLEWLGCTHAEAVQLNGGRQPWSRDSCARKYIDRKRNAKRDGIEWKLTFPEWCALWGDRWKQIGRARDSLVIARKGSNGSFSFGNCYITTLAESSRTSMAKTIRNRRAFYQRNERA